MTDRKTVIGLLEGLTWDDWSEYHSDSEAREIAKAALEMLKEQEPVEPIKLENWWKCPSCSGNIVSNMKYCPRCGRELKWE